MKRKGIDGKTIVIQYNLPMPSDEKRNQTIGVLPVDTLGGPFGTVPELFFEKKGLIPALQQILVSHLT